MQAVQHSPTCHLSNITLNVLNDRCQQLSGNDLCSLQVPWRWIGLSPRSCQEALPPKIPVPAPGTTARNGMGGSHPPMERKKWDISMSNRGSRGKNEEYKKKIPKTALQQLKSKVEWNTRAAKEVVKVLRSIRNTQLLSGSTFESWVLKASKATHPPEHPHRLCFYGVHKVFSRLWWDFSSILFILQVCLINKWTL